MAEGSMQAGKLARSVTMCALLSIVLLAAGLTPAHADAIDGEWCREGRHFVIEGPRIVTYGGTRMTGDYDRHGFRYTVPAHEPEAGTEIVMQLHSETTLELFRRAQGAGEISRPGEIWNRCRVTS
jgi:hypothetical protein